MKLEHLSRPVRFLWVCPNGHIGAPGRKRRADDDPVQPCIECGEDAHLLPVTPSGKTRRRKPPRKPLPDREEPDPRGPVIQPEPLPEGFELTERQLGEFANGEVPVIAFPKAGMAPLMANHLYRVTDELNVLVTGFTETKTQLVAKYEIHRSPQTVREDGVFIERTGATRVKAWRHPKTGEHHPAQPEAERVTKKEANRMTMEVHEQRVTELREDYEVIERALTHLEKRHRPWMCQHARKQAESIKRELEAAEKRVAELRARSVA